MLTTDSLANSPLRPQVNTDATKASSHWVIYYQQRKYSYFILLPFL